ncbi:MULTISPECIES: citrate synthase [unclassified Arthrobacter]|uniref:citrate synthase n=1 Tax=unclassified Arthrobacter TaxID=235627 RepID=UPI001D134C6E|nr:MULTISPECIES: citrate synthase [unclassified Arthrobacter]MCC3276751.1 citrate synthase [Arthrobacter sp. zg-Y20]MCC3277818.1 citrate synthase [Arthrobacter sp. zg-Y40]MCC9176222.1 citrate synthase [Arthrobacter sp. zg-Y750]MDK1316909.1 citrate synthase [Arthrobacter sp. zg.Y20]MDK1327086.1 citrate synthase [Arthrobacter sp. zg-Y1143]
MTEQPSAKLQYGANPEDELVLPRVAAAEGNDGLDVSKLLKQTGTVTFDPGFMNTAATTSAITYIDGDQGILRYRGYPIEQLAKHSSFLETSYLLIYGELPTPAELENFDQRIRRHTLLHEDLKGFFGGFPRDAHPMPVLSSAVSALSTFYQDSLDPFDEEQVELSTVRLMAKLPVIAAYAHKKSIGQPMLYPDNSMNLVENFMRLSFGLPAEPYEIDPDLVKALDLLLILHADHEQNCSTSTVRLVGSSNANMFASVSAGISALFGPLHGGANEAVLNMLRDIQATGMQPETFMEKVKNKEDGVKLMGFGHRVYKNYDPRAKIVKATAHEILSKLGGNDELLDIAMRLEEKALADDYFIERKLYPNVDFYTGLIYKAMGFPEKMFTVLFAIGRLPGWIAQWREMMQDPQTKIGRPRQLYTGAPERNYPQR